jgi:hypothetical protein
MKLKIREHVKEKISTITDLYIDNSLRYVVVDNVCSNIYFYWDNYGFLLKYINMTSINKSAVLKGLQE